MEPQPPKKPRKQKALIVIDWEAANFTAEERQKVTAISDAASRDLDKILETKTLEEYDRECKAYLDTCDLTE